jgi:4-hydroxymandelate oxidase
VGLFSGDPERLTMAEPQRQDGAADGRPVELPTVDLSSVVCATDFEALARPRLTPMAYDYIAGAAGDEISLRRNRDSFDAILLKPRVLRDVSRIDPSLELLGIQLPSPILLAPAAYHRLCHCEGELETARAAAAMKTPLVISALATTAVEDIGKSTTGPLWFQLYVQPDRGFTAELVRRAEMAGCKALCLTVDSPVLGTRNREMRDGFALPAGLERSNLHGYQGARASHFDESGIYSAVLDPSLHWGDLDWLRSTTRLPIVLKGIMAREDAELAVEHGVDGIIVSNHGARNLDTTPATIEALPGVVEAVAGKIPVLVDGGIRRGTDVIKALALGARAVLIGRPYLWALTAAGSAGVEHLLRILQTEVRVAMALCGCRTLADVDASVLWDRR